MKLGIFENFKNSAEQMLARYDEWLNECAAWREAHPDAEEEQLPECPLSTTAALDAKRTIELWNTVYTKLDEDDLAIIMTYPIYCPADVRAWNVLREKYHISHNELRTLLRTVSGANR